MRCDHDGCDQEAQPAILAVHDDDESLMQELRLMLCPTHTAVLVAAMEVQRADD